MNTPINVSNTRNTVPPTTPKKKSSAIVIQSPYFSPSKRRSDDGKTLILDVYDGNKSGLLSVSISDTMKLDVASANLSFPRIPVLQQESHDSGQIVDPSQTRERLRRLKPDLIQERVADDPWKLLVAVTLLNKTAGKLAIPVFHTILERWPTPYDLSRADEEELVEVIRHLGTQNIRTKRLIAISRAYVQDPPSLYDIRSSSKISRPRRRSSRFFSLPRDTVGDTVYTATPISHYPGTGRYALDSYRIFSTVCDDPGSEEWKTVMPSDKELILFLKWKWAFTEGKEWSPTRGALRDMSPSYLTILIDQLEKNTVTSSVIRSAGIIPEIINIQNSVP